jgi:serine/threonine protein kinase
MTGQRVVLAPGPGPGTLIHARYRIEAEVGHGARGIVFAATDVLAQVKRAVKITKRRTEFHVRSLLKEAATMRSLDHPGVLRVYDSGLLVDGHAFLVTDLVSGEPLSALRRLSGVRMRDALLVARRVADVLSILHDRLQIHCDVKPQNVIVPLGPEGPEYGDAKLIDFGHVTNLDHIGPDGEPRAEVGTFEGSVDYMAPEQLAGRAQCRSADVFGVGGVLFYLIYGRTLSGDERAVRVTPHLKNIVCPYVGAAVLTRLTKEIVFPADPPLSPELRSLVESCLKYEPGSRPRSATDLRTTIDALLETVA